MPTVEVSFTALPTHVRTARLVAAAVARRAGVDEAVLDEVRLAVGEACARAVGLHQQYGVQEPIQLMLDDEPERFVVRVADRGPLAADVAGTDFDDLDTDQLSEPVSNPGRDPLPDLLPPGFGLAVIAGLVDDVDVSPGEPAGTVVRMTWKRSGHMPDIASSASAES